MAETRGAHIRGSRKGGRGELSSYRKGWALIVGINEYGGQHRPLRNARNDAREFAQLLRYYGFEVTELYDEHATRAAILGHLRDTLPNQKDVQADDGIVIFFAGHGVSQEGKRGYLVPYGAGQAYADYISMGELDDACETLKARHILFILDCCFSGLAATRSGANLTPLGERDEQHVQRLLSRPAWQILMAGDADEPVADSGHNRNHSVFTYHLLQGLSGAADQYPDHIVTGRELEQYLYNNVYAETKDSSQPQIPFMRYLNDRGNQGDFVFRIPEGIPHPWVDELEPPPPPPPPSSAQRVRMTLEGLVAQVQPLYLIGGALLLLLVLLASVAIIPRLRAEPESPEISEDPGGVVSAPPGDPSTLMTGEFNIAVADFAVAGDPVQPAIGQQVALVAAETMQEELQTLGQEIDRYSVWGPDKVGRVEGFTREQRARAAEQIAARIGADVVVYAFLDFTQEPALMTVEFAIPDKSLATAYEIAGEHQFGRTVAVVGNGNAATRVDIVDKLETRLDLLSTLIVGLSYYHAQDYARALDFFQLLESAPGWEQAGGKEILYLLLGNTYGKQRRLDEAEGAYQQALALDSEYARAYAGQGGIYYLRALAPAQEAGDMSQADLQVLEQAITSYEQAAGARNQPVLANIPVKVDLGLGQSFLLQSLATGSGDYSQAAARFEAVVTAYETENDSQIRQLAAEAHANLGFIYKQQGKVEEAVAEYSAAVDLATEPERRRFFQEQLNDLRNEISA